MLLSPGGRRDAPAAPRFVLPIRRPKPPVRLDPRTIRLPLVTALCLSDCAGDAADVAGCRTVMMRLRLGLLPTVVTAPATDDAVVPRLRTRPT